MKDYCAFCDIPSARDLSGSENFSIIPTFGQITEGGYLLLIPKQHISCIGAMGDYEIPLLESFAHKISHALSSAYNIGPLMFEHGIVGQTVKHAHVHFVPAICDLTGKVQKDFLGKEIDNVPSLSWVQKLYMERREPYLLWTDLSGRLNICWNPAASPQYFRTALAETLGRPERANWRTMDRELDRELQDATIARLKPYFS